tara:strand:- start:329 stop:1177 length:849 start_codon:yes stop_codon:yes gene_type:complete
MSENKSIIDLAREAGNAPEAPMNPHHEQPAPPPQANSSQEDTSLKDTLASLLEKVEDKIAWVSVDLPTAGVFTNGVGSVEIRPFTFEDEKILRSIKKVSDAGNIINTLVSRCTKNLNFDDLALTDKNYILFKLRELSYGSRYDIEAECNDCGAGNKLTVELDKLPVNYATLEDSRSTKILLPDSEVEVEYTVPVASDEKFLTKTEDLMDNLWRFVKNIAGHKERMIIQGFISKTTAKDVTVLRSAIFNTDFGLQTRVNFICNECQSDSVIELPINEGFFDVS